MAITPHQHPPSAPLPLTLTHSHTHTHTHQRVVAVGQAARLSSTGCRTRHPNTPLTHPPHTSTPQRPPPPLPPPKLIPLYIPNWKEEGLSSNCFLIPLSPPHSLLLLLLSPPPPSSSSPLPSFPPAPRPACTQHGSRQAEEGGELENRREREREGERERGRERGRQAGRLLLSGNTGAIFSIAG